MPNFLGQGQGQGNYSASLVKAKSDFSAALVCGRKNAADPTLGNINKA